MKHPPRPRARRHVSHRYALGLSALFLAMPLALRAQGVVSGHVTDLLLNEPVTAAVVAVSDTEISALTDAEGLYRLPQVPAGPAVITVQRLGYLPASQTVDVITGETITVDIALTASPVALDAVVATAAGQQRRRELGNASSIVRATDELQVTTPVDLTQLLQGRASGVQIAQSSGSVGTASRIRIRGNSSISLDNTPLIYIDGARASNDIVGGPDVGGQTTSRLNDLDPNDIESIEIVKGPSAATLYGTEAAGGVIRITTRRGRAGINEWTYRASLGASWDGTDWPDNAISLHSPFFGPFGSVARDTIYTTNLLEGVGTNQDPWRTGLDQAYGASLRGGVDRVTYFLSGELGDREGAFRNNESKQRNVRANLNLAPTDNVDVAISTGFGSTSLTLPDNDNSQVGYLGVALNNFPWELPLVRDDPVTGDPDVLTCPYDYEASLAYNIPLGTAGCTANAFFSGRTFDDVSTIQNTQKIERFTGSVAVDYRPPDWDWLEARGTVGYDEYSDQNGTFVPVDPSLVFGDLSRGYKEIQDVVSRNLTVEGSLVVTRDLTSRISSRTTLGGQFFRQKMEGTAAVGRSLPAGTSTVSNAVETEGFENVMETRTLGLYIEQQFGLDDRLFLTPAVRFDENSAFGVNLGREAYPRVMASYAISDEPWFNPGFVESLHLRAAWGQSGKQPTSFASLQLFDAERVAFQGQDLAGVSLGQPGNPDLKPERGSEWELGFEGDFFDGRIAVDFTWYDQMTKDAIVARQVAPSTGFPDRRYENIGAIRNSGVELGVTAVAMNRPDLFWTVQLVGSTNKGKVTRLDNPIVYGLNGDTQRHQQGYPFGAYFSRDYFIGDGGTVQSTEDAVYVGQPTPKWEGSLSTTLRLFNRLTLYANLGFAGGHQLFNSTEEFRCGFLGGGTNGGICPEIYEVGPEGQPTDAARIKQAASADFQYAPWIEDADYARLRTVGVRFDLPLRWAEMLGGSRADFTLTADNLFLWTGYSGVDPEINFAGGDQSASAEFLTLPPARRVTGRISITF